MSIKISLELSDSDLSHFRALMQTAIANVKKLPPLEVISKAEALCKEMENANVPDFVKIRLHSLVKLIAALKDDEWQIPEEERTDILTSLAYFSEPEDLVPDNIPGLGYLDDAIMIELVIQDMSLDLEAYDAFCNYRKIEENRRGASSDTNRDNWLAAGRAEARSNLRRRRSSAVKRSVFSRIM